MSNICKISVFNVLTAMNDTIGDATGSVNIVINGVDAWKDHGRRRKYGIA